MRLAKTLRNNLLFLLVESGSQIQLLQQYTEEEDASLIQRVMERRGYAYNLNLRIQNSCIEMLSDSQIGEGVTIRTVGIIATELTNITILSRDCIQQLGDLRHNHRLDLKAYQPALRQVCKSMVLIEDALMGSDTRLALKIGHGEYKLNRISQKLLKAFTAQLKQKKYTEDLVTGLFVAHSLGQMGDALLRISESIISNNIGQPMDMQRYHAMQETITAWKGENMMDNIDIQQLAETRSGSGISSIQEIDSDQPRVIYKSGEKRKLKEELHGVETWHAVYPGLAPQVLAYNKRSDGASLLIEHLNGMTLEQIVLHEPMRMMTQAIQALGKTVTSVWKTSRTNIPVSAGFIRQTRKRLADVYAVHPSFRQGNARICASTLSTFESLLVAAEKIEKKLSLPNSVLIHGDFNVDNILYDPESKSIRFIDLHRSTYMDYVQDVSVFMVSNYRLQVFDSSIRRRIRKQVCDFYAIARKYAKKNNDHTFEVRLALGLARSFATSTRFILDESMAQRMFLRAHYLLLQVTQCDMKKPQRYRLPIKEIFSD
ncbi:hypothetical protein D8Y20_08350 [Mariprofundus sp. EBB-1]|uniref:aminoglycoside phosphotransferase family protein n=1 Tax=Mariprofundus sp. EBB-1 TaxID=2650971 RepID=UPI000EF1C9C5|nr:phosphotransferase [Mariprofundus sp. EBB-1]RLL51889.1 hypothetical protein D8Y20_08350 [Mariprofundus sp. EBB-1]